MKKLMTIAAGLAVPGVLVASFYVTPSTASSSSVAGSRAHAIEAARSTATTMPTTTTTVTTPPAAAVTTPTSARLRAAVVVVPVPKTPPTTVPDLTGATGKATNAPLVPGHWTQATNGAIYRDPSPYTEQPVGANDPAYEAGLNAQLCMPGKPEFCQP